MGMFSKDEKDNTIDQQMNKAESQAISSIVDNTMKIKGEISFKGKARIDGQIDGNIDGEHLVLSTSGVITGDVTVSSFICQGKIDGNIKADLVTARKSCTINGKLESSSLTVEPGAAITGEIKTSSGRKSTPAAKTATISTAK